MATVPIAVERAGPGWGPRGLLRRLRSGDEIAHLATLCFAASVILITTWLVYVLWVNSALPRHKFGLRVFLTSVWDPMCGPFGALPFIYGTWVTSAVALLLAVPAGLGAAIFLAELAPQRISVALTFVIDLLVAVPRVIYGLLGIFTVVPLLRKYVQPFLHSTLGFLPLFQGPHYGVGFLAAGVLLAVMVMPFIISVSREVLLAVPGGPRATALALGATCWGTPRKVVVPFARLRILGAGFLALARALGGN